MMKNHFIHRHETAGNVGARSPRHRGCIVLHARRWPNLLCPIGACARRRQDARRRRRALAPCRLPSPAAAERATTGGSQARPLDRGRPPIPVRLDHLNSPRPLARLLLRSVRSGRGLPPATRGLFASRWAARRWSARVDRRVRAAGGAAFLLFVLGWARGATVPPPGTGAAAYPGSS